MSRPTKVPNGLPLSARVAAKVELESITLVEARLELGSTRFDGDAELDVRTKSRFERQEDRLLVEVGVWLQLLPTGADVEAEDDAPAPLLSIVAEHVAMFHLASSFEADEAEHEAFVEQSGMLTVWPFARETIHGLAARAGFPQVLLPIRKAMLSRSAVDQAESSGEKVASRSAAATRKPSPKKAAAKKPAPKESRGKKTS